MIERGCQLLGQTGQVKVDPACNLLAADFTSISSNMHARLVG